MKTLDENTLKAIARLSHDHDFKLFINWLTESYLENIMRLPRAQDALKGKLSGRAIELEEILDVIGNSRGNETHITKELKERIEKRKIAFL